MSLIIKRINIYILFLGFISLFACDRTFDMDIISVTPPELHVYVAGPGGAGSGATVHLFRTDSDRTNNLNAVTKTTDGLGLAIYQKDELTDPGVFYLAVEFEGTELATETPYLLLNDGHTRFEISF